MWQAQLFIYPKIYVYCYDQFSPQLGTESAELGSTTEIQGAPRQGGGVGAQNSGAQNT